MMRGSVGSRGSPMPKSITSSPAALRAAAAWFSRTNGYVAWPVRMGEIGIAGQPARNRGSVS